MGIRGVTTVTTGEAATGSAVATGTWTSGGHVWASGGTAPLRLVRLEADLPKGLEPRLPHLPLRAGARKQAYLDALGAMRSLDRAESGGTPMTGSTSDSMEWIASAWNSQMFAELCLLVPGGKGGDGDDHVLSIATRGRDGWAVSGDRPGRAVLSIGGPMTDVELATAAGCAARATGLVRSPVRGTVYDSGTVVGAVAALAANGLLVRALQLYRLMDSVGLTGKSMAAFAQRIRDEAGA
jgi:hypothetical protein